jgi:hypothetical protein
MKLHVQSNKNGAILVIVMVVLIAVSLLTAALLQLGSFNELETIRQLRTAQAHWLAEAGLERALSRVMASKTYRTFLPNSFSNDEILLDGLGSYTVEITKDPTANPLLDIYTITSTGMTSNNAMVVTNTVRLKLEGGAGGQQAIIALGGSSTIQNSDVYGSIYQAPPGTLTFKGGNNFASDVIDAKGGIVNKPSGADEGTLDPGSPTLDRTPYTDALNTASTYTNAPLVVDNLNKLTNNLVNGTNYVNGALTINIDLPANRTLVASGPVTFPNSTTVGAGVKIVAGGNVSFGNHIILKEQTQIFTLVNISFATQGATATNGTILLAMGDINPAKNIDFYGILYAEGKVLATSGSNIRGTIIAGQGFDIAANCTIYYDPSVFANPNPINYGNSLAIQTGTLQWEESPLN